jgi:hypothetical protein
MADADKNIKITPSRNKTTTPKIVFTGSAAGTSVITMEVLNDNSISFYSNEGQVFSLDNNLTVGTIWSVNDVSGTPLLRASAGATIGIAEFAGFVGIGQSNPLYKLDVKGQVGFASTNDNTYSVLIDNSAAAGSNSLQLRKQNDLRFYGSADVNYTAFQAGSPVANTTYTLPIAFPGSGTSVLSSDTSGNLNWVASGGGGGSGTVTTLTAGSGITFSTGTTITTTGTIRAKRPLVISFCTGYTPTASGADTNIIRIPDSPTDGTTALTYIPREFHIRVETPSAGTSTIQLEKYTGTSAFSGTAITSLSITGGAVYEVQSSVFAAAGLALTSGDKMRINFTALNATHANFSVTLELEEF